MNFDAVIFDLDGVITDTASVHAKAWKQMFDEYLLSRNKRSGEPFHEFTFPEDYLQYIDGKPRYEGVTAFLASRNISIPYGDPVDPPTKETVCGLGNRKNELFNTVLKNEGVKVYESSVRLILALKEAGILLAVGSSSRNCRSVLETAGLLSFFQECIGGIVSKEEKLKGKPEPDIFLFAASKLGVPPHRAVVIEDAVSGVRAGKRGKFGLVIGVARENNEKELRSHGADWVVKDLSEVTVGEINQRIKQ